MPADDDIERLVSSWSADHLVEEAARSRSRRHWMGRQQAEESDLSSLLRDLADARTPVVLTTRSGSAFRGVVEEVGRDYLRIVASPGPALIRLAAVSVVSADGAVTLSGRRPQPAGSLGQALSAAEMTGAPVHLRLATGTTVRGVVELVAEDFVAIEPDGDRRQRLYLPLEAVDEALFISG